MPWENYVAGVSMEPGSLHSNSFSHYTRPSICYGTTRKTKMIKYLTTIQKDMQDAFSRNIGSLDCTFFYSGEGYFIKKDGLNALFAIRGIKICRLNFT